MTLVGVDMMSKEANDKTWVARSEELQGIQECVRNDLKGNRKGLDGWIRGNARSLCRGVCAQIVENEIIRMKRLPPHLLTRQVGSMRICLQVGVPRNQASRC